MQLWIRSNKTWLHTTSRWRVHYKSLYTLRIQSRLWRIFSVSYNHQLTIEKVQLPFKVCCFSLIKLARMAESGQSTIHNSQLIISYVHSMRRSLRKLMGISPDWGMHFQDLRTFCSIRSEMCVLYGNVRSSGSALRCVMKLLLSKMKTMSWLREIINTRWLWWNLKLFLEGLLRFSGSKSVKWLETGSQLVWHTRK